MCRYVLWLSLLTTGLLFSGTIGLQFNDDTYLATVWETPAEDAVRDAVGSNPPTPIPGVVATTVCVKDDGSPVNTTDLRYSIVEGNTTLFSVNNETGDFSVEDYPFDYEEQPWYLVKLSCFLTSDPSKNGTGAVNITIGSLNEYLPEYGDSNGFNNIITIKETTPVGTVLASVDDSIGALEEYPTATDRDRGPDGRVQYILTNTDNRIEKFLELDPTSGTLTLKAQLDIDDHTDTHERLEIEITACNENVMISTCPITGLTIFVTADNEHHPVFGKPVYTTSVLESAMNDTHVIEVQCEDEDNGEGSVQSISFESNTSSLVLAAFELSSSGNLTLYGGLDYENTTKYEITLVCFDGHNTATTQVIVNVLPVNDNLPQFTLDIVEFSAHRTDPPDTIIGQVEATDADTGGVGDTITYSIDSSPYFDINSETGEITLKEYLDTRDGHTFDFDVVASDGEYKARKRVRVTTTGLLSVPEWIYVGGGGTAVIVILVVLGIIVFYCFIKAARIRIVEKYREQETPSDSELVDMGPSYPHPPMFPLPPPMFPPDAGMSMVGQPLYPGMEDEEDSEASSTLGTLESSHNPLTPGPVLKEVVDYFHEGDKVLDKKGSKK